MRTKILDFIERNRMVHQVMCVVSKSKFKQYYHAIIHDILLSALRAFYPEEIKKLDELFKDDKTVS